MKFKKLSSSVGKTIIRSEVHQSASVNPLNAELNPIRHLLALVGARHIVHFSRIRVNRHPIACLRLNINCSGWLCGLNNVMALLNMKGLITQHWTLYRQATDVDIVINYFTDETQNCRYLDNISKFQNLTAGFLESYPIENMATKQTGPASLHTPSCLIHIVSRLTSVYRRVSYRTTFAVISTQLVLRFDVVCTVHHIAMC